jgi:hypothetical protein
MDFMRWFNTHTNQKLNKITVVTAAASCGVLNQRLRINGIKIRNPFNVVRPNGA